MLEVHVALWVGDPSVATEHGQSEESLIVLNSRRSIMVVEDAEQNMLEAAQTTQQMLDELRDQSGARFEHLISQARDYAQQQERHPSHRRRR